MKRMAVVILFLCTDFRLILYFCRTDQNTNGTVNVTKYEQFQIYG